MRVDKLVLIVPAGIGRQRWSILFTILPLLWLGHWGRKKALQIVIGPASADSEDRRPYQDFMALVQRHFRARMERIPISTDTTLQQLKMAVLTILGGRDVILDSAETKHRLERNVPHAEIRYLPELGHAVIGVRATILEFLSRR